MTDGGGHTAYLAVFPLGEFERKPSIRHVFAKPHWRFAGGERRGRREQLDPTGQGGESADRNALAELGQSRGGRDPLNQCPIASPVASRGVEELMVQVWFIGEEQQPFGIRIESSERIDLWGQSKFSQGAPT